MNELARTPVSPEQEPKLRLYRRLSISAMDLEEAKKTIDEILERKLPYPGKASPSALLQALTTALVICYARPFINSRGQSVDAERVVPSSLLRFFTSRERAFHDDILVMRNREVAHSDADILEMYLELNPDGDATISRVARNPFRRSELAFLRRMINKIEREIERLSEQLRAALPHNVWL